MYERWVEEVDDGNMVGVMMVDLSAAFDMVDHGILLEKLRLYGLEETALSWMTSYLSGRSQSVYIDGCLSPPLDLDCGVPQGSILGPLMYKLFTNDVPNLVHSHLPSYKEPDAFCDACGGMVHYVDDATYSAGLKDPEMLSEVLSNQYETISNYMVSNKLVINDDKTQLLVLGTRVNKAIREQVSMQAGVHTI